MGRAKQISTNFCPARSDWNVLDTSWVRSTYKNFCKHGIIYRRLISFQASSLSTLTLIGLLVGKLITGMDTCSKIIAAGSIRARRTSLTFSLVVVSLSQVSKETQ